MPISSTKKAVLLACLFGATNINGLVLPRAVLGVDKVVGLAQTIPSGSAGATYLKYQPLLNVVNGCYPYPAVDASGNTNGGLETGGDQAGGCKKSTGQVYVRSQALGASTAIMYAWYFPKDQAVTLIGGHRHDWESTVVWVNSLEPAGQQLLGVAPSGHGKFTPLKAAAVTLSGTRPQIDYASSLPQNHALAVSKKAGSSQPLVAWESMPAAAKAALTNTNFGSANVPFIDKNFKTNLDKALLR